MTDTPTLNRQQRWRRRKRRKRWVLEIAKDFGGPARLTQTQRTLLEEASLIHEQLDQVNVRAEFADPLTTDPETRRVLAMQGSLRKKLLRILTAVRYQSQNPGQRA